MAYRFPVEAGQIMLFARAIGDGDPRYDDPDTVIAPPTFVQASAHYDPDYPLRPRIGEPWFGSGKEPSGGRTASGAGGRGGGDDGDADQGTSLHAEQHFTYHQPFGPGDVLTVETRRGATWEKQGKRAGTLQFRELITEFRNDSGELVVTARLVGVLTQRPVGDGAS